MTVSRVLNNHPYVSEDTRKRVLSAVDKLGFRPNTLARRFFTGKTQLIGVVVPFEFMFSSFYFKELFQGICKCFEDIEYDVLLHDSASARITPFEKCEELVKGRLVEGLLVAAPMEHDDYPVKLTADNVPLVVMGETAQGNKVNRVGISNRKSTEIAVRRLTELGHRRIMALIFGKGHVEGQQRAQGYQDALKAAGIAYDEALVGVAGYNRSRAYEVTRQLLTEHPDITAIMATNADMALGAADALREMQLKIPTDVSLISFDDCEEMEQHTPPISAIRQFPSMIGFTAAQLLLDVISGKEGRTGPVQRMVDTEFVDRGSTAPPAAGRRGG